MLKARVGLRRLFCSTSCVSEKSINITKLWYTPESHESKPIRPYYIHYIENGKEKCQDILKSVDAVIVLIYNKSSEKLVLVRQFRPSIYDDIIKRAMQKTPEDQVDLVKYPPKLGITLELCAGLVDKPMSLANIAREEMLEECGFNVPVESLEHIYTYRSGGASLSGVRTMFYCEVCDSQKVENGGGIDDENIEVVEISINEAKQFVQQGTEINGPPGLFIGLLWFLYNKV